MISIVPGVSIDEEEVIETFVRSGGPGGQNVNKVSTAVQLRFNVLASKSIPDEVKTRLIAMLGKRTTSEGDIIIHAQSFRTQERNRAEARERLVTLVRGALQTQKKRKRSRPTYSSTRRRREDKKLHGEKKANRHRGFSSRDIE